MLHFNSATGRDTAGGTGEVFKVLVIDDYSLKVVATLLHTDVLRQHGVTLVLAIDKAREAITDAPVVYLLQPTMVNADAVVKDLESGLYKEVCQRTLSCCTLSIRLHASPHCKLDFHCVPSSIWSASCPPKFVMLQAHLNFVTTAPDALLERIAEGMVKAATPTVVAKVFDQHLAFIALEQNLFTLALADSYVQLNDSKATEKQLDIAVAAVVNGLFSVCATLSVIPKIRCAPGGLAEHVARALSRKIVQQLAGRGAGLLMGGVGSTRRPVLCIFDRNFDLTPMAEQPFTYKTLVHDCLGMHLNKVEIQQSGANGAPSKSLSIEITADDAFWQQNGHQEFGAVAAEMDSQV
jgi:sec1 family domain-containing protein 1